MIHGGKLIGVGGYGCVFAPSLISETKDYVTKILEKEDAEKESKISMFLEPLDPEGLYGSYVKSRSCNTKKFITKIREELTTMTDSELQAIGASRYDCQSILRKPNAYCILEIPKYTHDLDNYVPPMRTTDMMIGFLNLFRGLQFLHGNFVIHCDIKLNNLAYQDRNPMKHAFVFADWGLSKRVQTCEEVDAAYESFPTSNRRYISWNPALFRPETKSLTCDQKRNLLFLNDVNALALSLYEFLEYLYKRVPERSIPKLRFTELRKSIDMLARRLDSQLLVYVNVKSNDMIDLFINQLVKVIE